jgi:hypothetical protein
MVFLIVTSEETSPASFQWMRNFASIVVGMLAVGRDRYQIGLAQYGDRSHIAFLLNTYRTQNEVMTHIQEHFVPRVAPGGLAMLCATSIRPASRRRWEAGFSRASRSTRWSLCRQI